MVIVSVSLALTGSFCSIQKRSVSGLCAVEQQDRENDGALVAVFRGSCLLKVSAEAQFMAACCWSLGCFSVTPAWLCPDTSVNNGAASSVLGTCPVGVRCFI